MTTSGCEDNSGCDGFGRNSGGGDFDGGGGGEGGCDDGGVGDGVGVWTGVEGWAGVCCEILLKEIPAFEGVEGRPSCASMSSGSVTDFDVPSTSPCSSWVNVVVTVAYGFVLA